MADINLTFNSDDLEQLKKLIQDLNKEIQKLKKFDVIGEDDVVRAKKQNAELLKATNALKRQEMAAESLAARQERLNQKQRESSGIIGGLEAKTKDLRSALKSATDPKDVKRLQKELREVRDELQKAKGTTASWSKALGSFQFKFNALGNIAANVLQSMTRKMSQFVTESVRAAAEAEGIRRAFDNLNRPGLLDELRKSVKGTVSDVRLMQAAVKANNFKIPLEQLGSFFQFAQQRAVQTGESVDYLVESITNGIARKSLPILDNLGLSATEVRTEFARTGDMAEAVANIINRSMTDAAEGTLTSAELFDQATANAENLKIEVGRIATLGVNKLLPMLNKMVDFLREALQSQAMIRRQVLDANELYQLEQDRAEVLFVANKLKERGIELDKGQTYEQRAALGLLKQYRNVLVGVDESEADRIEMLKNQILELEYMAGIKPRPGSVLDEQTYKDVSEIVKQIKDELVSEDDLDISFLYPFGADRVNEIGDEGFSALEAQLEKRRQLAAEQLNKEVQDTEEAENRKKEIRQAAIAQVSSLIGSLSNLYQQQKENELSAVGDSAEQRLQIEKDYAKKQQNIAVAQALINGAQAVTEVWSKWASNPPVAALLTTLALTSVGIQVAAIKKQKFAKGGEVGGHLHSQGGTVIEAEKGEYVINRRSTAKHRKLIEGINDDDQLKIMMAMDRDRRIPAPKSDPWTRKIYQHMQEQEVYGETNDYFIIKRGNHKTLIRKH